MIERKLKNRKFCRGVQISNRGSKSARTLRQCKFLKNLPTTASVGVVAKAYLWFFTEISDKNELSSISLTYTQLAESS